MSHLRWSIVLFCAALPSFSVSCAQTAAPPVLQVSAERPVTFDLSRFEPAEGMQASVKDGAVQMELVKSNSSHLLLHERLPYDDRGEFRIVLGEVKGGAVTVQVAC